MERQCKKCGKTFMLIGKREPFIKCTQCREIDKINKRQKKNNKGATLKKSEEKISGDLIKMRVLEVENYNKTHGTHFSYGKYFSQKELGLLKE